MVSWRSSIWSCKSFMLVGISKLFLSLAIMYPNSGDKSLSRIVGATIPQCELSGRQFFVGNCRRPLALLLALGALLESVQQPGFFALATPSAELIVPGNVAKQLQPAHASLVVAVSRIEPLVFALSRLAL